MKNIKFKTLVTQEFAGWRLDLLLTKLMKEYSRAKIQFWIESGDVLVNKQNILKKSKIKEGDLIVVNAKLDEIIEQEPENIPLNIIFQDESLIIINKPSGLVVHPGAGNPKHTLVNALLNYDSKLKHLPRAGIVHRLDKDTSGIMIIARTLAAYKNLVEQLQERTIKREYQSIVCGYITTGGVIQTFIGRNTRQRTKMMVKENGKKAITHFRVIKRFKHYTHLKINLETGRTHQIRVHMEHIHHPIVGDPTYGKNSSIMKGLSPELKNIILDFNRQALHAYALTLKHPSSTEISTYEAKLPEDFNSLLKNIYKYDSK